MRTPRPYQRDAVDAIYANAANGGGRAPLVAIPTAGGKSLIMATIIREVITDNPAARFVVLAHVKELVQQNYDELLAIWPDAPAGIVCAGLGRRDLDAQIVFATIQSLAKHVAALPRATILVDEAHLIPRDSGTRYRKFFSAMRERHGDDIAIAGFTATPFRLDSGLLHEGDDALFTHLVYEVSIRELIDQGYLAPLTAKKPDLELDVTGVHTRGGDYIESELQAAVDKADVTAQAVNEIIACGHDRKSWLAFCSGVDHAYHVRDEIRARGVTCETIVGSTPAAERDAIIAAFKRGEIRALSGVNVLAVGFNAPAVDLIAMLRPTQSTGLFIQMAGRGTRLAPDKDNCLILDFAGNAARHGPIDAAKPKKKGEGPAPTKVCPCCRSIIAAGYRDCPDCGHEFVFAPEPKITPRAANAVIMSNEVPESWAKVSRIDYRCHEKPGGRPSLRVSYQCGLTFHSEWVCLQHEGGARWHAERWWRKRASTPPPCTIGEALDRTHELRAPTEILVRPVPGKPFTEIVDARFS